MDERLLQVSKWRSDVVIKSTIGIMFRLVYNPDTSVDSGGSRMLRISLDGLG